MTNGDAPDFDAPFDRRTFRGPDGSSRPSDAYKWARYERDVLPAWVADMDFPTPPPIIAALQERVGYAELGYADPPPALADAIATRSARRYGWTIDTDTIVHLPGLVNGFNIVTRMIGEPGDGVLVCPPVYPPLLAAPANNDRTLQLAPMVASRSGSLLRHEIDLDRLTAAITPRTRLLLWCSPHNPTGQLFTRAELDAVAELCLRHGLWICADEIWSDVVLSDEPHIPIASLDESVAARTITLMAPGKAFNTPATGYAFAVVHDAALRQRINDGHGAAYSSPNVLGYYAALAAYTECDEWLAALRRHLAANRDLVVAHASARWAGVAVTEPRATYLTWIDLSATDLGPAPAATFERVGRVALAEGAQFGPGCERFVRLNFACSRPQLIEILDRMDRVLAD